MSQNRDWTRVEVLQALALYLVTPFGRMHSRNPEIVALAAQLGRTASSIALRLVNFASLDDSLAQKGMSGASNLVRQVWSEFLENGEIILGAVELAGTGDISYSQPETANSDWGMREGTDIQASVKQRRGQDFFHKMILASYENRCALTGIDDARLLVASHILPWAESKEARLNPHNGICLNALHDKAFDRHLIAFDDDLKLLISPRIPDRAKEALLRVKTEKMRLPIRFAPKRAFLQSHRQKFDELVG